MKRGSLVAGAGFAAIAMIGAVVVARADDDPGRDEQVATGQEPSSTVPADEDAFVVDRFLARGMVAGMGDRFVVAPGGRQPTLSVLDPSGETVAEVAVPIADGTGLGHSQVLGIAEDRALVTGVECSTVREDDPSDSVVCDPGDGFVATFALDSQEWAVLPGPIDPGPQQALRPLGVHDDRAVIDNYDDLLTLDLATGSAEPLPPGGGPSQGRGVRCLVGDVVIRGDTYSSPAMRNPEPGEVITFGDEPFTPFAASTFDLTTGAWGAFVPAPEERPYEESSVYPHCAGDGVVALPGQSATGEPLIAYRFSPEDPTLGAVPGPALRATIVLDQRRLALRRRRRRRHQRP